MNDNLHAACDSRIMALESALHIANTDAAHAVARLMGERDTAGLQVDHLKAENERLQAERDRWKVTAEEADAFIRTWHEADPDGWQKVLDERDRLRVVVPFFASVIKSGEPWSPECERALRTALDISEPMGGPDRPPAVTIPVDAAVTVVGLDVSPDENDPANWAFEWPSRERPTEDGDDGPWHCGLCGNPKPQCQCGDPLLLVIRIPGLTADIDEHKFAARSMVEMINAQRYENWICGGGDPTKKSDVRLVASLWLTATEPDEVVDE